MPTHGLGCPILTNGHVNMQKYRHKVQKVDGSTAQRVEQKLNEVEALGEGWELYHTQVLQAGDTWLFWRKHVGSGGVDA